jgi:hypothetical protein
MGRQTRERRLEIAGGDAETVREYGRDLCAVPSVTSACMGSPSTVVQTFRLGFPALT